MIRPIVVTGAASGIGAATVVWLHEHGYATIGIDRASCDITADLGTPAGRAAMRDGVGALAPGGIGGIIACAGVSMSDGASEIAVNFFGAVATFELLRPLLAGAPRPRAVVISSSALLLPTDTATVAACLAGHEAEARELGRNIPDKAYASSKLAITKWMEHTAVSPEWAGQKIALNAVAPGTIRTPMTAPLLATEEGRSLLEQATPKATADYGTPADVAEAIGFLATIETSYILGQTIFVDGGTEVLLGRADR